MQKRAKNEVLGHFLGIGVLDRLDIAYYDSAKCFSLFGYGKRSCIVNEACVISIIYAKKSQKSGCWPLRQV